MKRFLLNEKSFDFVWSCYFSIGILKTCLMSFWFSVRVVEFVYSDASFSQYHEVLDSSKCECVCQSQWEQLDLQRHWCCMWWETVSRYWGCCHDAVCASRCQETTGEDHTLIEIVSCVEASASRDIVRCLTLCRQGWQCPYSHSAIAHNYCQYRGNIL